MSRGLPLQKNNRQKKSCLPLAIATLLCGATLTASCLFIQNRPALFEQFTNPPAENRPMVRWWWFGPYINEQHLVNEVKTMKAGGYGGFEIQSVYPLRVDGNSEFLSPSFIRALKLVNKAAHQEEMRLDLTLGSGWPFGGPHITTANAATRLERKVIELPAGSSEVALPELKTDEKILAVFSGDEAASARLLHRGPGPLHIQPADHERQLVVMTQRPTYMEVKRPSIGAEGYVLDHMSAAAVKVHLQEVGEKLLDAFGNHPPYAIFSDSLEVYGADWTPKLLDEFQQRRGYDLTPHLPKLFEEDAGSAGFKYDWGLTLSELVDENYLIPVNDWAQQHNTRFRSQTYGFPPVTLSSNRLVSLSEGEGSHWRRFTSTRWTSSANHLYNKPVTSAESWTWLHQGAYKAIPLDIKAEADKLMLQGVNHFIGHGWPSSPPEAGEPGWAFYAAAVLSDRNPWWTVMPDVNLYLQRMSFLMQQGKPVVDVAVYLPQEDALSALKPGQATINENMHRYVTDALHEQLLNAGYNFDYIDAAALPVALANYKVLILPRVSYIQPAAYQQILHFAAAGGLVIAIDRLPEKSPGHLASAAAHQKIASLSKQLFSARGPGHLLSEEQLGSQLATLLPPDVSGLTPELGFVHRRLPDADIYFVVNTSNRTLEARPAFRDASRKGEWWDARTGDTWPWVEGEISFAPYESRVLVFGRSAITGSREKPVNKAMPTRLLDTGWTIRFDGDSAQPLNSFTSWTVFANREYFSGTATYTLELELSTKELKSGLTRLNLGEGSQLPPLTGYQPGSRALLTPPMRDAAEIFVNGTRAGSIWSSPFSLDLSAWLKPGLNRLEIRVANTAINQLAGQPGMDYSALHEKYGQRFSPQHMHDLTPLPSGLLQPPRLEVAQ